MGEFKIHLPVIELLPVFFWLVEAAAQAQSHHRVLKPAARRWIEAPLDASHRFRGELNAEVNPIWEPK